MSRQLRLMVPRAEQLPQRCAGANHQLARGAPTCGQMGRRGAACVAAARRYQAATAGRIAALGGTLITRLPDSQRQAARRDGAMETFSASSVPRYGRRAPFSGRTRGSARGVNSARFASIQARRLSTKARMVASDRPRGVATVSEPSARNSRLRVRRRALVRMA